MLTGRMPWVQRDRDEAAGLHHQLGRPQRCDGALGGGDDVLVAAGEVAQIKHDQSGRARRKRSAEEVGVASNMPAYLDRRAR
eukprot:scaffold3099_cov100-Isochrysis_galbana.AAC.10